MRRCAGSGIQCCGPMSWAIGRLRRCSSTSRSQSSAWTARFARSKTCASIGARRYRWAGSSDGHLVCAYHGWTYDPDGVCTRIPASHGTNIPNKARIVRYRAAEHAGLIWVCLDDREPAMPLPAFPEWADDSYRKIRIPQYDWHCSAARRVENFVDFSHFAWVHEGILGDRSKPEIPDHDVVRDATTLSFELGIEEPANPSRATRSRRGGSSGRPAGTRSRCRSRSTSTSRSRTAHTSSCSSPPARYRPRRPATSPGTRATTSSTSAADQGFVDFQQVILEQDRVVVESQRPEELPIDLSEELHIKGVDRVSIDYRRWLGEIAAAGR